MTPEQFVKWGFGVALVIGVVLGALGIGGMFIAFGIEELSEARKKHRELEELDVKAKGRRVLARLGERAHMDDKA